MSPWTALWNLLARLRADTGLMHASPSIGHLVAPPSSRGLEEIEPDRDKRSLLAKQIWRLRWQERRAKSNAHLGHVAQNGRAREWRQTFGPKVCINAPVGDESRAAWPKHIADHFSKVFSYTSPDCTVWRSTLRDKLVARFTSFAAKPEFNICFSVDDVSTAIASLKTGKACAEDGLNSEMLKALNRECLLLLACAFSAMATSGDAHEPVSWHLLPAVLIPKAPRISSCNPSRFCLCLKSFILTSFSLGSLLTLSTH